MTTRTGLADVLDVLRGEGGVARTDQVAARIGRTPRAVRDLAAISGLWTPFPGVVGLPTVRPSSRDRALAATLRFAGRTGDPARDLVAVTRRSALALLGVQATAPSRVELVVPASRCPRGDPRCTILRSQHLDPSDVARRDRVPIVAGPALVRDLAGVRTIDRLRSDVIELLRAGYVDLASIQAMLVRCQNFAGRGALRRVLVELSAAGRTDSPLEFEARRRFRSAGIVMDRGQVCVPRPAGLPGTWRMHLDLGMTVLRFGIELDSFTFHSSPQALQHDAERANRLAAIPEDWRVIHVTWAHLQERWSETVRLTKHVIEMQAARHGVALRGWQPQGADGETVGQGPCRCER